MVTARSGLPWNKKCPPFASLANMPVLAVVMGLPFHQTAEPSFAAVDGTGNLIDAESGNTH